MLKRLELSGFKSFAKKTELEFSAPITAIVGPNGSGKSNITEAIKFVLGEQSHQSLRSKKGEDLIWNGSKTSGQSNRAAVEIVFDNKNKVFKVPSELSSDMELHDEISISREVYRNGENRYLLNGTQVRLRDIFELLSSVNIGASGHHIISQGEADRILNASSKERKLMIEEALGLKIYHWKIEEGERRLKKTNENLEKVTALRREIAPHLKFLKKQVDKIKKAEELKDSLKLLYREYLKRESIYLDHEQARLSSEKERIEKELSHIKHSLSHIRERLSGKDRSEERISNIRNLEEKIRLIRLNKDETVRKLGRLEAEIEFENKKKIEFSEKMLKDGETVVPINQVVKLSEEIDREFSAVRLETNPVRLHEVLEKARRLIKEFISRFKTSHSERSEDIDKRLKELLLERDKRNAELKEFEARENSFNLSILSLKSEVERDKDKMRELEKQSYEFEAKKSECEAAMDILKAQEELIIREKEEFENEIKEGRALIGEEVNEYKNLSIDSSTVLTEPRFAQEARRKEIEKKKIRLEDMGGGGGQEVLKEYKDTEERDKFLEKEIKDLEEGAKSLNLLVSELKEKLNTQFESGVKKINERFSHFFSIMFGGGNASVAVTLEKRRIKIIDPETGEELESEGEAEIERGIEIKVNLPHKKIKDLAVLSGGERALTSIALLFAISQVNPPPFLVLDETDAALDEANSRKYGDMLEELSKNSQIIVVTHNRETMSRAGILYGVTMGMDATSKLLSVKFNEAAEYSK